MIKNKIDTTNPLEIEGLVAYIEEGRKAKQRVRDMMGAEKVVFPIDGSSRVEELEGEVREELSRLILESKTISSEYIKIKNEFKRSNLINNTHVTGMKFTKVISKMLSDQEKIDEFLLLYSRLKSEVSLPNSCLVFSVAPLDFANMGIGKKWNTCYAPWSDNYSGGFSLGLDEYSFLIYITSNIHDPSSKTYRRVGTFNEDYTGIVLSSPYPYNSDTISDYTIEKLREVFDISEDSSPKNPSEVPVRKWPGSQIYFDFLSAEKKKDFVTIGEGVSEEFRLGKPMFCLLCGFRIAEVSVPYCKHCIAKEEERISGREN